jgi:hypothetical protein
MEAIALKGYCHRSPTEIEAIEAIKAIEVIRAKYI